MVYILFHQICKEYRLAVYPDVDFKLYFQLNNNPTKFNSNYLYSNNDHFQSFLKDLYEN